MKKKEKICIEYNLSLMADLSIEILNPKAKKLFQYLAELKLISISKKKNDTFLKTVKRIRSGKPKISLEEITKEVEAVRAKRYGR